MLYLFDPFRRAAGPRPVSDSGLGLGLFIAQEIIVAHRGRIEVRSSEKDGTTFEELLAAGDERMYRDKAGRRSRNSAGRHSLARSERA